MLSIGFDEKPARQNVDWVKINNADKIKYFFIFRFVK
jgi:hypothetical protein